MRIRTVLAAAAMLAATATGAARADSDAEYCIGSFCIGSDDDVYGPPGTYRFYGPGIRNDFNYRAISCRQAEEAVRWNGFRKVRAIDCGLPAYRFRGWRDGKEYTIRVNGRGAITRVTRR